MSQKPEPMLEFSRPIPRARLAGQFLVEEISATPRERTALARRFRLLGLGLLRATARIEPADGTDGADGADGKGGGAGLLRLNGHLSAEVSQACVMTLEPVASRIEEDFTLLYSLEPDSAPARAGAQAGAAKVAGAEAAEVVIDPEAEEPPEPLGAGGLDLGEAVAQQLAVALDPYPRAPGAALAEGPGAPGGPATTEAGPGGAFAVLEALKRRE
ncbi:MAG: DUF177 domain-containing protein [Alphaproteobacteria bacterium]